MAYPTPVSTSVMCTGILKAEDFIPSVPCLRQLVVNPGLTRVTHKCHNSSCEHSGQSESPYVKKWRTPTNLDFFN